MAFPTVTTQVAWATDPGDTPTWSDVSAYVVRMSVKEATRNTELDRFEPATLTVVLDNSDGRFDSENTSSPYYPNVEPVRRVWVKATYNAVAYDLFVGFIENLEPGDAYPQMSTVTLTAVDGSMAAAAMTLDGSPLEIELRNSADLLSMWYRLGEDQGSQVMVDSATHGPYHGVYESEATVVDALGVGSGGDRARYFGHDPEPPIARALYRGPGPISAAYPFTVFGAFKTAQERGSYKVIVEFTAGVQPFQGFTIVVPHDSWAAPAGVVGRLWAWLGVEGGTKRTMYSSNPVDDDRPHSFAVVVSSGSSMTMYVDGVSVGNVFASGSPSAPTLAQYAFGNSVAINFGDYGLLGTVDDVAVFRTALSAARVLALHNAWKTGWAGDLTGTRITRLLDAVGWPASLRSIDAGQSTLQAANLTGQSLLDELHAIAETEAGSIFFAPNGTLCFRDRHSRLKAPYTTSQATFSDQAAGINYSRIEPDLAVRLVRNKFRVARAGGTVQVGEDATSKARYLARTYNKTGLQFENDNEALAHGQWILDHYKDPPFRYGALELEPYGADATLFPQMLGRQIGDRVTVQQQPPYTGSTMRSADHHVEGKSHEIDDLRWKTVMQLSPADPNTYWVLGVDALGVGTRLGY